LLLQSFLFANELPRAFVNMLLPLGAALLVLAAALAGYVMVKFFGVIFLGQPREATLRTAHDAGIVERIGLAWLALGCGLLGLFPTQVISSLSRVIQSLGFSGLALDQQSWWLLVPLPQRQTSYSPLAFLAVILTVVLLTIVAVRLFYHQRVRLGAPWDCGFGRFNSRMQDTAEGFGQPIRPMTNERVADVDDEVLLAAGRGGAGRSQRVVSLLAGAGRQGEPRDQRGDDACTTEFTQHTGHAGSPSSSFRRTCPGLPGGSLSERSINLDEALSRPGKMHRPPEPYLMVNET
jgi:hypothetical protein